jgi:hypothetical protein
MTSDVRVCHDCKRPSPTGPSDFTLISSKHGWRLARERQNDGTSAPVWRCPDCWQAYRARRLESGEHALLTPQAKTSTWVGRVASAMKRIGSK